MASRQDWAALAGRLLLAAIFVQSGFEKLSGFAGTVGYIKSAGLPMPEVGAVITIVVELVGGLLLVAGYKTRFAALAIAVFTIAASFAFHRYWADPAGQQMVNYLNFWKNLAIAGGMLMVFAFGPGRLSVDRG